MKLMRTLVGLGFVATMAACSGPSVVSRGSGIESGAPNTASRFDADVYRVVDINVNVPRSLTVSEANRMFPREDIVWRGEPVGDRYKQIGDIILTSFTNGTNAMTGPKPIILDIEVRRFHALTQRARYSVGGTHDVDFILTVRDAKSGAILQQPRAIDSNLKAYGGDEALLAEARGETQKVRIERHLASVILGELTGKNIPTVSAALNFR